MRGIIATEADRTPTASGTLTRRDRSFTKEPTMPAPPFRTARLRRIAVGAASIAFAYGAAAQAPARPGAPASAASAAPTSKVENSDLDARLFYQLLIGEIQLREGEAGTAYQVMLDAARRTKSEEVFRRATDIALQARAGEQALTAVQAWRAALPESTEALRYQAQLLVAMNRPAESQEPLAELLRLTPVPQRPALITALPRFFARSADRKASAELVAQVLKPYLDEPGTQTAARVALGRSWLAALDTGKALDLARRAHAADPTAEGPALLALEMLPGTPAAEAVVSGYIVARPDDINMRLLYVRSLTGSQRYAEAIDHLERLTKSDPQLAPPWLTLGALHLELKHPKDATAALLQYVKLVEGGSPVTVGASAPAQQDGEEAPASTSQALTQAWLLLAQAAEEEKDYPAAEAWLAKIDNPQRALEVQLRRASMLARQDRLNEARELIRRVPEQTPADARAKLLAEAQLLRDRKAWSEAEKVLAAANTQFPDDVDLLYEQAMMEEKLDRLDEMERLLRRVIALKPDHQHAYNALGYSLAERKIRLPEARELIVKALELSPGEPFITDSLGWVEYRMGNSEEALRLLRGAYQSRPDPEIAAHLGEVLWATGRAEEARRVWREGRSRDATNDVLKETLARLRVEL
jgi:tetratricopeptide (TPR) repeat protein